MSKLSDNVKAHANVRKCRMLNISINASVMIFLDIFIFISEALNNDNIFYMYCWNEASFLLISIYTFIFISYDLIKLSCKSI